MAVWDRHYLLRYKRICLEYGQSLSPNWSAYALGTRMVIWFGHGCSGQRMLLEHEHNDGLGMDALISVCFCRTRSCGVRRRKSESLENPWPNMRRGPTSRRNYGYVPGELWVCARRARALGAPGAKPLDPKP